MRSNAYCGNLLWQSSLTHQAPGMDATALTEAKAAFVITRIAYDEAVGAWICEVADGVGEGGAYGNGYVHFISVRDSFPGAAEDSDFLRAVLLYAPVNGD